MLTDLHFENVGLAHPTTTELLNLNFVSAFTLSRVAKGQKNRPDRAFLRTVTNFGTDVSWVTSNRFRRGAPKILLLGGEGRGVVWTRTISVETPNVAQMFLG